jgi:hypothetical protein
MFKKLVALLFLTVAAATSQTSTYPASVDTDANLKVAVNNINTQIVGAVQAGDTTMTLLSSTGIVANMMLSIDTLGSTPEVVCITGVSPIAMTRGCDGTTAVVHISGSGVHSYIPAWYHNILRKAIEAIETQNQPQLPAVPGMADVLNCNTTSNITSQPVAWTTTWTMPAFTQTAGSSFVIALDSLNTTSGSAPTLTVTVNIDGTVAYTSGTVIPGNSLAAYVAGTQFQITATTVTSSGTVEVSATQLLSTTGVTIINHTAPLSLDTTVSHTVSVRLQCSANTAGNQYQLVAIKPMRVY